MQASSVIGRLLVVSHPAVVGVNQEVYRELQRRGWRVTIVLPSRWRSEYSGRTMTPQALEGMEQALRPTPVALRGRPQRHVYLTRCRSLCSRVAPDVVFLEAEAYSLAAAQWAFALRRLRVPFGVQCYENIDRALPAPVRVLRSRVLRQASFVAARSDSAGLLALSWGAQGEVGFAPPAVPPWASSAEAIGHDADPQSGQRRAFTIGYAGRLVESKGLDDLLAAVRRLDAPVELLLIGDGEMRPQLESQRIPGSRVRVLSGISHEHMADGYAQIDVLALPSRTTSTWKEQFGRVIVEALWCGVPVVGSDSGEIPWLIGLTGGGLVFAEGDSLALATQLNRLRESPELRQELAGRGRAAVEQLFSAPRATDQLERLLIGALTSKARIPAEM
ncbi:MAG: glycosyltransferase family 4 protein [Solirubrobacteraceae bacterium]